MGSRGVIRAGSEPHWAVGTPTIRAAIAPGTAGLCQQLLRPLVQLGPLVHFFIYLADGDGQAGVHPSPALDRPRLPCRLPCQS